MPSRLRRGSFQQGPSAEDGEGGSQPAQRPYAQRVQAEYLKEVEDRGKDIYKAKEEAA